MIGCLRDYLLIINFTIQFQCARGFGIKGMLEHITELPPKIAFIGPGCSIAAESVAETLPFWNLTEVSDKDRILLTHDYFFNKEFCPFQTRRLLLA